MANAAKDRPNWTLGKFKVMFHVDDRALLAYTNDNISTPKLWRRMEGPLQDLWMETQYRPGKEMLADEFTRLSTDGGDGRYRGILLRQEHFSEEAWKDIIQLGGGKKEYIKESAP